MENKIVKKLVNNITEEELLSLEEGIFFNKDVPEIDSEMISKLKNRSREKYNDANKYKKKFNIKKIILNTMVLVGILVLCGSVTMLIIENKYSYILESDDSLTDNENLSVMEKVITINKENQELSLQSVIWSDKEKAIYTTVEGNGEIPNEEGRIFINDKEIKSSSYRISNGGESWRLGHIFKIDFKYNEEDKIKYVITNSDGEEIDFDINLVKSQGKYDYKKLGPSNVKDGIAIIGIINEEENMLDVNFTSVVEGKGAEVIKYGDELLNNEVESSIVLTDANGKEVLGEAVYHGDRFNNFRFDTTDLIKPYKIYIPKVTLGIYDLGKNNEIIRIKLPKDGKKQVDKEIKLVGNHYIGMDKNRAIKIVDIKKLQGKFYEINIEFPQNIDNNIKISTVRFNPVSNIINYQKDFVGYGEELDKDNILKKIIIETTNTQDEFIRFNIKQKDYIVEGKWELNIN